MGSPGTVEAGDKVLVLFDGVCNLCNGAVKFIIRHDPKEKFVFASLQSEFGRTRMDRYGLDPTSIDSIVVLAGDQYFLRSDAVFRITRDLSGGWPIIGVIRILPKFFRDALYDLVATWRYRLFGRRESCMIPTDALRSRFVG